MEGVLIYDIDEPWQKEEFLAAASARQLWLSLYDMNQYLVNRMLEEVPDEIYEELKKTNEFLHNTMDSYGVDLDMLS